MGVIYSMLNSMGTNNEEAQAALSMSVNIRIPDVETAFCIEVNLSSTVEELKALIEKECGIPAVEQNLIYNARVMRGAGTLRSFGVEAENTISLIRSTPEAPILDPDFELSEPEFLRLLYTNNPIMRQVLDCHPEFLKPLLLVGAQNIASSSTGILLPEQRYADEMSKLKEMGFLDTRENIRALIETAGNIEAAAWRLLSGLLQYMGFSATKESIRVLIETASRKPPAPPAPPLHRRFQILREEYGDDRFYEKVRCPEWVCKLYKDDAEMRVAFDLHPEFLRHVLIIGADNTMTSLANGILLPELRYADEISQLRDMGFPDIQENIRVLVGNAGNVKAAAECFLGERLRTNGFDDSKKNIRALMGAAEENIQVAISILLQDPDGEIVRSLDRALHSHLQYMRNMFAGMYDAMMSDPNFLHQLFVNSEKGREALLHHPELLRPLLIHRAENTFPDDDVLLPEVRYANEITLLHDMGFVNNKRIIDLLIQHFGTVEKVAQTLLEEAQRDRDLAGE